MIRIAVYTLLFIKTASFGLISLDSDNRFYTVLAGFEEKFNRSVHTAVIGDCQAVHPQFFGSGKKIRNFCESIQKRKFAMAMKMYKVGHNLVKFNIKLF